MGCAKSTIVSFALLAVLFGLAAPAHADSIVGRLPFRHYGSDDGLPSMNLYMGTQDGAGFTWVAGTSGLVRYDGIHFRRYGVEDGLPSLLVTDIAVAPDGVLWGATAHGAFYESKGELVAFGTGVLPENGTYQVAFDREGRFVVTTAQGPFVRTAPDRLELVSRWPGGEAFAIRFEPDGTLLVGHGTRLLRRAPGGLDFEDVGQDFGGTVTALVRDGRGRLWLRAGARLWAQRRGEVAFEDRTADYLGALPGPYPRRLGLGADQALLIPSTVGLIRVDDAGARFLPLELPSDALSLRDVWVDREGAIWVAGSGLHRETGRGLWRTARVVDGLPSNAVWGMVRAPDGALYVATETGAARSIDGRLERLPGIEMAGYVTQGPPGTLWFAGDGRITRYDVATGAMHVLGAEAGLPPLAVVSAVVDEGGYLWAAFDSGGVYRATLSSLLAPATAAPARLERVALPEGDPGEMVTKILVDGDKVWLASGHGLYLAYGGAMQRFTTGDGLRSNAPSLLTHLRGEICVAYAARSDISCFVHRDGKLADLHHLEVPGQLVPELLGEDANGRLWVGTTRGVTILDGDRVDPFARAEGAPGDDVNFDTFFAEADGTVWIGSSSGLGRFDGTAYDGPPPPPSVRLVSGKLAGRAIDVTASRVAQPVPYESPLVVDLASLSSEERRLELQVKLLGYDEEWQVAENHQATYQKLPGGRYRFAARARRPWGAWGPVTTLDFEVRVAFWQRWYFRLVGLLVAVLAIAQVTRYRARSLQRKNALLESVVEERTSELKEKNIAARRILDAVEQGLFSVTPDGTIEAQISAAACRWFGVPAAGQRVWDWLPDADPAANRLLEMGWATYRDGFMPQEVVFDQLPQRFAGGGRTYALQWLPNETSDGALVVATDITETLETEQAQRARHETMETLRKLHEDRSGYLEFLEDGERLLEALEGATLDAPSEARHLHTLKGNSAIFGLQSFAEACHELETRLEARRSRLTEDEHHLLGARWKAATRHLLPFLDVTSEDGIRISHAELSGMLDAMAGGASPASIEAEVRRWWWEPTRPRLDRIAHQARRLAESLGKGPLQVALHDHGVRLPRGPWRPLWSSLIHLVRNAVDHGLEPEAERVASGKSAVSLLSLSTRMVDGELVIAIEDDGRGLDWAKVARAAAARGLPSRSHEDLVDALFVDGLSTADAVTAISGRGVGMAAVREATLALGGRVVVRSEAGGGTRFELRFPESTVTREAGPAVSHARIAAA